MSPSVPGLRIGIDLGGTKIEGIGIDVSGAERARRRVATPCGDYDGTLAAIAGVVLEIESGLGARGSVGVGMPGAISPASGLVKNANSTWLNGRDLRADLERILERPLRFANDANCLALSEATDGAAAGAESVFGVILGTGTGGGVVLHGRPLTGPNAIAGEWGHNPLPWPEAEEWPGPECYCGKRGCIETFTSGPGLIADHARCNGERLDPNAIDARARAGDSDCEATLVRYESRLARGLASVVNLLDPDVIVLGGGLSNLTRLYRNLPPLLSRWAFSDTLSTRIEPPRHGDSSGVRGAAWLWDGAPEAE